MKKNNNDIQKAWPITEEEYLELEKEFGDLCHYEAWQLLKKNNKNNHTDTEEDIVQNLRISMMKAGSYYKRQVYIESCLSLCKKNAEDKFVKKVVKELHKLWKNKTRHGANKQKFGPHQEKLLYRLVKKIVPVNERPKKKAPLKIDAKFAVYCKNITWNEQKYLGKKITREKSIRTGLASVSNYDYLASTY